jgi:ABC-type multidrug transport system ATPase subunit
MDRIIVLHDGYVVYQGPTNEILPYLGSMGIKVGKYVNPADFIIKTVQAPLIVRAGLTVNELTQNYEDVLKPRTTETMDTISKYYDGIEAAFSKIARTRQVSKCI